MIEAASLSHPHLVFVSQVFFNSGAVVPGLDALVSALPAEAEVVIDGYHGFCAVPTSLAAIERRCFYLSGGYKYAMTGEGACFLHVPNERALRPRNTGWFAAFGTLQEKREVQVPYATGGSSFIGATFDPTALYRFNAVMRWRTQVGLSTPVVREHAHALQRRFVEGLTSAHPISPEQLVVPLISSARGQFLTFRTAAAKELCAAMKQVITDARDDRWRFDFGP